MDGMETQYDKWVMEEVAAAVQAIRLPDPLRPRKSRSYLRRGYPAAASAWRPRR